MSKESKQAILDMLKQQLSVTKKEIEKTKNILEDLVDLKKELDSLIYKYQDYISESEGVSDE